MTPALAVALTRRQDAGALLADLERDSSLVLGVGAGRQWFRMHPLLRSYLQADLARHSPGMVAELHETAAAWFIAQELPDKAFAHVTTGEDHGLAALLCRHAAPLLLAGDADHAVRGALTKVGEDAIARSPRLTLISALRHTTTGDCAQAGTELASRSWTADPDEELVSLHRLVATTHALACGRPPEAVPADWSGIVAAHEGGDLEAWARLCLGWTHLCTGDRSAARREVEAAERLAREHGFDFLTLHCLSVLGMLSCSDGAFPAVEASCGQATDIAAAHGLTSPSLAANHVMIGLARLMSLDPAGTLVRLRHATAGLTELPDPRLNYVIDLLTGTAWFDTGRQQDGLWLIRDARRALRDVTMPAPVLATAALLECRCALELGDGTQPVIAWARNKAGEIAEVSLMQAWTSFTHGDPDTADTTLEEVLSGALPTLCPTTPLEARLLETALQIRQGRRTKAMSTLNTALLLAEPAALVRPFHLADISVRQLLLEHVGGFGRSNGFADRVSHAISAMNRRSTDSLTNREHTVLVLLSTPQSLDEMASDLSLSVNTVKTHVRAIYEKLGVNTRRAAVVTARQLGID